MPWSDRGGSNGWAGARQRDRRERRPAGIRRAGIEWPLALLPGAFAVQVLGPGCWSLDAFLPVVDVLYGAEVSWIIVGLAVAGALLAAFLPSPAAPED